MAPQLIIFDMAGTTVRDDRFVHQQLAAVLSRESIFPTDSDLDDVMGLPKPVAIARLLEIAGQTPAEGQVDRLHEAFLDEMISFYQTNEQVMEIPGTTELFRRLRDKGIRVATDTGFSRDIAQTIIDRLGWGALLDASICSDEVAYGRPFPDMGFELMRRLGVSDPAAVMKVGDTASDMQMGRALGCGWIVGVESGSLSASALWEAGATAVVASVKELDTVWEVS